ncbi:MAG: hypothetical protein LUD41_02640 [Phascolarctobacterium sp.]|nr:hypothetical protein [Phascolarctobacterium sp.]
MEIFELKKPHKEEKKKYKINGTFPERTFVIKKLRHEYSLIGKEYIASLDFCIATLDTAKYKPIIYDTSSLGTGADEKINTINVEIERMKYSELTLVGEISRRMNIPCLKISKILEESVDEKDGNKGTIINAVNEYNEIIDDVIIPRFKNNEDENKRNKRPS